MQLTCSICDSETEATGEQGGYYDPLFTYKEGDEASRFIISEDSEGDAVDVGHSGDGASKESPMTSSSIGWTTEPSASEGGLDVPVMEAVRMDEVLPEVALEASPILSRFLPWSPLELALPLLLRRLRRYHLLVIS